MLEGLIKTQQIGEGFTRYKTSGKARVNRLVGTEYCSRGYHNTGLNLQASM